MRKKRFQLLLVILVSSALVCAQTEEGFELLSGPESTDTTQIWYFTPKSPSELVNFADTSLNQHFTQYDLSRQQRENYAHLGIYGSATKPHLFDPKTKQTGYKLGAFPYTLYQLRTEDIRFYTANRGFTTVDYNQNKQTDGAFRGAFSRKFEGGLHFSLAYNRLFQSEEIFNINRFGLYTSQKVRHTNIGIGLKYGAKKYSAFLLYALNVNKIGETGGLQSDEAIQNQSLTENVNLSVWLEGSTDAETKLESNQISFHQYLAFNRTSESESSELLVFKHTLDITFGKSLFYSKPTQQRFFGPLSIDDRGLRLEVDEKSMVNSLSTTLYPFAQSAFAAALTVGAGYGSHTYESGPFDKKYDDIFLQAGYKQNISEYVLLNSEAKLHLGDFNGDSYVDAGVDINLPEKWGILEGRLLFSDKSAAQLDERIALSTFEIVNQSLNKTTTSGLEAKYTNDHLGFDARFGQYVIDNYIYVDSNFMPRQESSAISVTRFDASIDLAWKGIHLDQMVGLQHIPNAAIQLPKLTSRHSLYYEGFFFRQALLARFGFDFRYFDEYNADGYQPALGRFYVQTDQAVGGDWLVDFFLSFKIGGFRLKARLDNITSFFNNKVHYYTPLYPIPDRYFRLGINWQLRN